LHIPPSPSSSDSMTKSHTPPRIPLDVRLTMPSRRTYYHSRRPATPARLGKPHFAAWVQVYDIDRRWVTRCPQYGLRLCLCIMPLCGFRGPVEHPVDVFINARQYHQGWFPQDPTRPRSRFISKSHSAS
jgi:hypothetical protein